VTSLADSGFGTLREALQANHRLIEFVVGGTIALSSPIELRGRSFVTIDGSTAPRPRLGPELPSKGTASSYVMVRMTSSFGMYASAAQWTTICLSGMVLTIS
jgi:hypothetical protein